MVRKPQVYKNIIDSKKKQLFSIPVIILKEIRSLFCKFHVEDHDFYFITTKNFDLSRKKQTEIFYCLCY